MLNIIVSRTSLRAFLRLSSVGLGVVTFSICSPILQFGGFITILVAGQIFLLGFIDTLYAPGARQLVYYHMIESKDLKSSPTTYLHPLLIFRGHKILTIFRIVLLSVGFGTIFLRGFPGFFLPSLALLIYSVSIPSALSIESHLINTNLAQYGVYALSKPLAFAPLTLLALVGYSNKLGPETIQILAYSLVIVYSILVLVFRACLVRHCPHSVVRLSDNIFARNDISSYFIYRFPLLIPGLVGSTAYAITSATLLASACLIPASVIGNILQISRVHLSLIPRSYLRIITIGLPTLSLLLFIASLAIPHCAGILLANSIGFLEAGLAILFALHLNEASQSVKANRNYPVLSAVLVPFSTLIILLFTSFIYPSLVALFLFGSLFQYSIWYINLSRNNIV